MIVSYKKLWLIATLCVLYKALSYFFIKEIIKSVFLHLNRFYTNQWTVEAKYYRLRERDFVLNPVNSHHTQNHCDLTTSKHNVTALFRSKLIPH